MLQIFVLSIYYIYVLSAFMFKFGNSEILENNGIKNKTKKTGPWKNIFIFIDKL